MTTELTYLENIRKNKTSLHTLDEIISLIRSDRFKKAVHAIRHAEGTERGNIKKGLPAFKPSVRTDGIACGSDASPTGIVQFDIDKKDNDCDFEQLKAMVVGLPNIIYAFFSASGGLKIGLMTDFKRHDGDDIDLTKRRFAMAYEICKADLAKSLKVKFDDSARSMAQSCFLSHDPDAYLNLECSVMEINKQCIADPIVTNGDAQIDPDFVMELLSFIPRKFDYPERFAVNCSVLYALGRNGIEVLFNHWTTTNRHKLRQDLEDQFAALSFGSVGHLVNVAKTYGYKPVTGKKRRDQKAKPSDFQFEPLLSADKAQEKLKLEIESFFRNTKSKVIRASCGTGKTEAALEEIRRLSQSKKILYVAPTHKLAEEIVARNLKAYSDENGPYSPFQLRNNLVRPNWISHIKGRTQPGYCDLMSANRVLATKLKASDCVPCPHNGSCKYISQFDTPSNFRVATFHEIYNKKSMWWSGSDGNPPCK